ncbi:PAS domain S-box-containing protein [Halogranum rubrum]|uniref:PAS domain S-box-containing protein n=1 Tax=Halogranum rubrum TaxID=553466 RepID=A0A1I4ILB3_9EURY|nr:PAS domain S-box protein [Halogranum rubrum]SFL54601.1 PAS domain S-box-containing protein [Halogranum rubrum]
MSLSTSVLYVAADRSTATVDVLAAEYPALSVEVATSLEATRDRLDDGDFDCVVVDDTLAGPSDAEALATLTDHPTIFYTRDDSAETVRTVQRAGVDVVFRSETGGPHRLAARLSSLVACHETSDDETPHLSSESILEAVNDGVYVLDGDGVFVAVNASYEKLTGFDREELLGAHASTVTGETINAEAERLQASLEQGDEVSMYRTDLPRADGTTVPIEAHLSLFPLGNGEHGRIGVVRDVSEREQLKSELDQFTDRVTDLLISLDTDWRYTYIDGEAERFLDGSVEDHLGDVLWERYEDLVSTVTEERYREAMETQKPVSFETQSSLGDEWFRVNAYPSETGLSIYFQDISDRKLREQELNTRIRQQTVTAELSTRALEDVDLDALFQEAVERVAATLDADYCKVLDLLPDGEALSLRAGVGWRDGLVGDATVATDHGSQAGYTLLSTEPVVVDDLQTESRFSGPELLTSHDVTSGISTIIGPLSNPWGVLGVHTTARRTFSDSDVTFFQNVANILATAIDRTHRQHELRRYESMFQTVKDGVYALDADGNFLAVNDAYADITGFSRDELVGAHGSIVSERVHEMANQQQASLGDDGVATVRSTLETADGRRVPIEVRFAPFELEDGSAGRVGVVRDISERERLRTELDEVLERVTDAFFGLDTDWNITFINERAKELLARTGDELAGTSIWQQFPDAVGTTFETEYERAMETQQSVSFEEYFPPLGAWFRVHAYPSETGLSVYFRDITERKVREERLASLNRAMQTLLDTTTQEEVVDIGVETASETLGVSVPVLLLYDESSGHLVSAEQTADEAASVDEILVVGDDSIAWQVFVENEPRAYDSLSAELGHETAVESVVLVPMGRHGVLLVADPEPDAFSESDLSLVDIVSASIQSALDRADREETLRERSDTLETQNESLDRLRRINGVIRQITGTLTQASTREEIETAVCNRLASADPYRFAWIGTRDAVNGDLRPRVSAGGDQGFLSLVSEAPPEGGEDTRPAHLAATTLEPQVQNTLHGDPPFEPWREAALKRGFRSSIAVPIVHRETLYGVLCLYASEPNVFNRMEQTVLAELGEIIGHALNALERKRALVSEQSVELDFAVDGPLDQPLRFIADLDATFEYQSLVQRSDGFLHLFFVVRGVEPEAVLDAGETAVDVDDITLIADRDDELLFECTVADTTLFASLLDRGAIPQAVSLEGPTGNLVIRVPQNVEPRSMVELLERNFTEATLTARREHDDPVWTKQEFQSAFEDNLTDRQEEVLRTAYFAGFFEWPRESSGEDVADILGVSQPTVHRHVRAGERKLFSLLFDS